MKHLRDILGYLLGLVLFVGLMPTLMWLASGRPAFWLEVATKDVVAWGLMLCGLLLSIWTIVYMRYLAKSGACIETLAKSMMPIAVTLEDSKLDSKQTLP